jgi:hypothetical protein
MGIQVGGPLGLISLIADLQAIGSVVGSAAAARPTPGGRDGPRRGRLRYAHALAGAPMAVSTY